MDAKRIFHFRQTINLIFRYLGLALNIIGLIGNILMFLIYFKPNLRKLSVSVYFRAMALSNLFMNLELLIRVYVIKLLFNYTLHAHFRIACKLINFNIYAVGPMSAWFEVAASLDRFLTIVFPQRFNLIRKSKFLIPTAISIVIYNIIVYSYILVAFDLIERKNNRTNESFLICAYIFNQDARILETIDLVNSTLVPFTIMILTSLSLFLVVLHSRRRSGTERGIHHNSKRDVKFGMTLIFMNLAFVLCHVPKRLFILTRNVLNFDENPYAMIILSGLVLFLFYAYYSVCFFIQLAVNSLIQKEFFGFFRRFK